MNKSKPQPQRFSVSFNGETVEGSLSFVRNTIYLLGWPIRYSITKRMFINVETMHINHLVNAIKEEMSLVTDSDSLLSVMNGIEVKEFAKRINSEE